MQLFRHNREGVWMEEMWALILWLVTALHVQYSPQHYPYPVLSKYK